MVVGIIFFTLVYLVIGFLTALSVLCMDPFAPLEWGYLVGWFPILIIRTFKSFWNLIRAEF